MSLVRERERKAASDAKKACKLPPSLRQTWLILLICTAILLPTLTPASNVTAAWVTITSTTTTTTAVWGPFITSTTTILDTSSSTHTTTTSTTNPTSTTTTTTTKVGTEATTYTTTSLSTSYWTRKTETSLVSVSTTTTRTSTTGTLPYSTTTTTTTTRTSTTGGTTYYWELVKIIELRNLNRRLVTFWAHIEELYRLLFEVKVDPSAQETVVEVAPSGYVIKQNGNPITSISETVCSTFSFDLWIDLPDDLPLGQGMVAFDVLLEWNPSQVEYKGFQPLTDRQGWDVEVTETGYGYLVLEGEGPPWRSDASWGSFTFHCLGPGQSIIRVSSPPGGTIWIGDGQTTPTPYELAPYEVTCNQYTAPPPPVRPAPVGGTVYSANKLLVLLPYLALVGLASIAVVLVKRRKR